MNLRMQDSATSSQQQLVSGNPGSQLRYSMVSHSWFEGLRVVDPGSRQWYSRVSLLMYQKLYQRVGTGGPLLNDAIGKSHRPQMAGTSQQRLDRRRHVARGGTPAPEVSTIVIEAHAIHDAQPRGRDFLFVLK